MILRWCLWSSPSRSSRPFGKMRPMIMSQGCLAEKMRSVSSSTKRLASGPKRFTMRKAPAFCITTSPCCAWSRRSGVSMSTRPPPPVAIIWSVRSSPGCGISEAGRTRSSLALSPIRSSSAPHSRAALHSPILHRRSTGSRGAGEALGGSSQRRPRGRRPHRPRPLRLRLPPRGLHAAAARGPGLVAPADAEGARRRGLLGDQRPRGAAARGARPGDASPPSPGRAGPEAGRPSRTCLRAS